MRVVLGGGGGGVVVQTAGYSDCPTGFRELLSPSIDHLDVTPV